MQGILILPLLECWGPADSTDDSHSGFFVVTVVSAAVLGREAAVAVALFMSVVRGVGVGGVGVLRPWDFSWGPPDGLGWAGLWAAGLPFGIERGRATVGARAKKPFGFRQGAPGFFGFDRFPMENSRFSTENFRF